MNNSTSATCTCGQFTRFRNTKRGKTTKAGNNLINLFRLMHETHGTVTIVNHALKP
jgi:hypothetical protein